MTTTTSGAVGFAPVGTFVNDLAKELGKSASTLTAYLKKHLPTTLSKRKNSNNRLANWVTSDGEAGLRAHYKPTYAPQPPSELELEVQRLRARVAELEAENASLKAEIAHDRLSKPEPKSGERHIDRLARESREARQKVQNIATDLFTLINLQEEDTTNVTPLTQRKQKINTREQSANGNSTGTVVSFKGCREKS